MAAAHLIKALRCQNIKALFRSESAMPEPTVHRPGAFGRKNHTHKTGGHKSKGLLDKLNRGRPVVRDSGGAKAVNRSISRHVRKCQAAQRRKQKTLAAIEAKRALGGIGKPPALVSVLVFGNAVSSASEYIDRLAECDEGIIRTQSPIASYFAVPRFKTRLGFVYPALNLMEDVLDSIKVADIVCMIWPLGGSILPEEEILLSTLLAHGLPTVMHIVPGLGSISCIKRRESVRNGVKRLIDSFSLSSEKLMHSDSNTDKLNIIRSIVDCKKKKMLIQKRHSHMLIEKVDVQNAKPDEGTCTLLTSGYVRGPAWNVNRLVHIPSLGDFQVTKIVRHDDPNPLKEVRTKFGGEGNLLVVAHPEKQESLQSEIVPDPMEGEQILMDDDIKLTGEELMAPVEKKKVPRGTSSYQAAWILDDNENKDTNEDSELDDEEMDDEDEESEEEFDELVPAEEDEDDEELENADDAATEAGNDDGDCDSVDMDEVAAFRKERENEQWPDELDTPLDISARIRFQKYRGLKSFKNSPWDINENLPYNYARIFKFHNFARTKKLVMQAIDEEKDDEIAEPGMFVTLHIANVPLSYPSSLTASSPRVLFCLLPHEHKMSILNMAIKKHVSCTVPIINKSSLIFHVGFRRFEAEPIFSQHTNGDKFKMERYLRADMPCVASVFAPITFPPSSVLVFRRDTVGQHSLVATGCVLDNNPDRVVLKRVVLSGHPFKINKRSVVVRYMFFNRDDIEWFKPVELYTPRGRRGHIQMALGTHGHMKCRFDQQLNAQDSVMMSLYKRVFPKWSYTPAIGSAPPANLEKVEEMEQ